MRLGGLGRALGTVTLVFAPDDFERTRAGARTFAAGARLFGAGFGASIAVRIEVLPRRQDALDHCNDIALMRSAPRAGSRIGRHFEDD
jgi:hypothetical protein